MFFTAFCKWYTVRESWIEYSASQLRHQSCYVVCQQYDQFRSDKTKGYPMLDIYTTEFFIALISSPFITYALYEYLTREV
jgi:hypothetical protein